ncbi:hypothetical protein JOC37_000246 [Desulfohalotomaculum tongense]|nr:hypothetical protein [Desulforadius tongensis]
MLEARCLNQALVTPELPAERYGLVGEAGLKEPVSKSVSVKQAYERHLRVGVQAGW